MKMRKLIAAAGVAALLAGCTTTTGVVDLGDGAYMLGTHGGVGWSGSSVKADLIKEAQDRCAKEGKKFRLLSDQSVDASMSVYASAEIKFRCD
jgi:hypothetical protein